MENKTILEHVSDIQEFNDVMSFMDDADVNKAMELIVNLTVKPDVPGIKIASLIVKLQAMSAQFAIKAKYYTVFEKGSPDSSKRKNVYYTLSESLDKIVSALKYMNKI